MNNPECTNIREVLFDNISWINNLEVRLDVGDPEYEEQTDELDKRLSATHITFRNKPTGCQMLSDEEDGYACEACGFEVAINIDSSTA